MALAKTACEFHECGSVATAVVGLKGVCAEHGVTVIERLASLLGLDQWELVGSSSSTVESDA
jgi:hypothetical protein